MSPDIGQRTAATGHGHRHDGHGHSHGLIDRSIIRSRAGLRAVGISLGVLLVTSILQGVIFLATGSVALLADLIHSVGDALTAIPVGIAFVMRSFVAEKRAGYFVVAAIFISACVAAVAAIDRLTRRLSTTSASWPPRARSASSATRSPPKCVSAPASA